MILVRQNRKTISITLSENGEVIIKAPYFVSEAKVYSFVSEKQAWIAKQQQKIKERNDKLNSFDFVNFVYINGHKYNWNEITQGKRKSKATFYTKEFNENVIERAEKWASLFDKKIYFKLCNSKCIWGSCNAKNLIKLNWKMIILPVELQDYIIVHELCHTRQLNHSPKFWGEVADFLPNYKLLKNRLKEYSFILKTPVL